VARLRELGPAADSAAEVAPSEKAEPQPATGKDGSAGT
jgi:hypothetical protein